MKQCKGFGVKRAAFAMNNECPRRPISTNYLYAHISPIRLLCAIATTLHLLTVSGKVELHISIFQKALFFF